MKITKRILILFLTVVLILSAMPLAYAEVETPSLQGSPGQTLTLELQYSDIVSIDGTLVLSNPEYFSKIEYTCSGFGNAGMFMYNPKTGAMGGYGAELCELVSIKFFLTIADDAPVNQTCTVSVKNQEICTDVITWLPSMIPDEVVTIKIVERLDFTALNQQIANATRLDGSKYTAQSWGVLENALKAARAAATNSKTQSEINAATDALRDAIKALDELPPPPPIDYSALQKQITIAEGLNAADYTPDSYAKVTAALQTAKGLTSSNDQKKVDTAAQNLKSAIAGLVKADPPKDPDYYNLNRQIAIAGSLIEAEYTPESWSLMQNALNNAKSALNSKDQAEVDAAAAALEQAIAALEAAKPGVDYSELNKQLTIAEGLKEGLYTDTSWESLLNAVEAARNVLDSSEQAEVDAAAEMLKKAISELVEMNYQALLDAISRLQDYVGKDELSSLWYEMHALLNDVEAALNGGDQSKVDDCALRLIELLTQIEEKLAEIKTPETVIVEKPIPTTPVDDYCNIEIHRVWPILFWISLAVNVAIIVFGVVYIMMKRKKTTDDTPLVDYDISDDE